METVQDLYDKLIKEIRQNAAIQQVNEAADCPSARYYQGRKDALAETAKRLAIYFKCEPKEPTTEL